MNGWLLIRIAGIAVGVATLLRVATNEKLVTYHPLFLAWMDWLSDIVELGFLTKLIGPLLYWGIEQVRSLGISVPDLQDEWRPAFVLSTLLFAAIARHSGSGLLVAAAPVGALVIAVWSGLEGTFVPVAVVTVTVAIAAAVAVATVAGLALAFALALALAFAAIAFADFAVVGVVAAGATKAIVFAAFAVAGVVAAGVLFLFKGIVEGWAGGLRAILANLNFNIGIDILFTMAIAFVIAVAAAKPPIW